jgi:hypothetical protein
MNGRRGERILGVVPVSGMIVPMPARDGQGTVSRTLGLILLGVFLSWPRVVAGQRSPTPPAEIHEHVAVTAPLLTPTRETSGTAWLPTATPMYGVHSPWRGWDIRLNGAAFAQAIYEPRYRHRTGGASTRQGGSVNWAMATARRRLGAGRFGIRTMFSAEPWTVPGCGSLSYLATGEVCDGDTVHDRQPPHDAIMELAVDYERPLLRRWRWQIYAGLAGEPALGPPGYPHRESAMTNPSGPITHHWLDATHVSFGLVTIGVHNQRWKAEMSVFNGREPDESRTDVDVGAFDSFAARVSFLANERLVLQASAARLRDARTDFIVRSQQPVRRITASAMYHRPFGTDGIWATTLAYGSNLGRDFMAGHTLDATTMGALLESSVTVSKRHTVFSRGEVAGMPAHHLHAFEYPTSVFAIGKVQLGYVRHLRQTQGLVPGIGGSVAVSLLPSQLASRYSGRSTRSFSVFLSVQAARHQM